MLSVEALAKSYLNPDGSVAAGVFDVSFELKQGEFFTLLGPSGCGKTTTLRSVAGLERPDGGRIAIGGTDVFDAAAGLVVPMQRRRIGMVFQSYAVWPHMTVFENVAYPLRYGQERRPPAPEIHKRVMDALEAVSLAHLAERPAPKLSGGQQQRLALARALVGNPKLLLLDEPLSNLDATLRDQLRRELRRMQKETGVTALYVTHDQSEALSMSDRIAVLRDGHIEQLATPLEIYREPASRFVAEFIGHSNLVDVTSVSTSDGHCVVDTKVARLQVSGVGGLPTVGAAVLLRPENLVVVSTGEGSTTSNTMSGIVVGAAFLGELSEYVVKVGDGLLTIRSTVQGLREGDPLRFAINPDDIISIGRH